VNGNVWRGVLLTLLAVGVLAAAGAVGYQIGIGQELVVDGGSDMVRVMPGFGYGGFWILGGIVRVLFFVLLLGFVIRLFTWGRWAGPGRSRPWGPGPWEHKDEMRSRMESHLAEWHEKAHADGTSDSE